MAEPFDCPTPAFIGFADGDVDLYEFTTASGLRVFLHDLACVDIQYRPLTRELILTFDDPPAGDDPAITVNLAFSNAEILQWERVNGEPVEQTVVDEHPRVRGQVSGLSAYGRPNPAFTGVMFELVLLDLSIAFVTETVTVTATEGVWQPQAHPTRR
ncbi:hypothetical protein Aca07nite_39170 [Actinoplanes capillaceus]|uniref:Immunity protein 50 n=1 Tax=Actinoplanes campanulatus TaxID=113559 RepID=A0ABQ3WK74_9ACTN|nr:hypothetical protein [Actinoplanes capillaceus]GID46642.1 hypothetical protein Aca07nite_39170 [Actinoplanes capillaceus]